MTIPSRITFPDGSPILSCYFPLGDPRVPLEMVDIYADQGVDVLEIGLSSVDPFMDGAHVRASMARSQDADPRKHLDALTDRLARRDVAPKTLLMCYADAAHPGRSDLEFWSGLDSCLIVARESSQSAHTIRKTAIRGGVSESVFVGLPLDPLAVAAARDAKFYVMLQANAGMTGPRKQIDPESRNRIAQLRAEGVTVPILLGFGISNGAQARSALQLGADGAIVGSQVLLAALDGTGALAGLLNDLRRGLDA
jgi:tryptophan synthase alpha chain